MLLFQGLHGRHFKPQLTLPRLRSFNMADQELAAFNAEIVKAKARRDKLEEGEGGVVDRDMLFLAQRELVGLQEDKRRYIEKQGECLASRSPSLHHLLSPYAWSCACQRRIPYGWLF